MKIKVKMFASPDNHSEVITTDDLGISEQEWHDKTEAEQKQLIQDYIDDYKSEQPFWVVETINPI